MSRRKKKDDKGAIEVIEEAIHLLRLSPIHLLITYYTGTLPFILGLLYFWADMSRNAYAAKHCASASFALALSFLWMKCWHSVFCLHVRAQVSNTLAQGWSPLRIIRLVAIQTIIQPSGFFLLPIALLFTLPFGWVFAFYQNVFQQQYNEQLNIKKVIKQSLHQARLWPGQNHILLAIFFIFSIFVFLNLGIMIYIIPYILKKFLGIETMFTLSGVSIFNTTFLAATCAITYLCMDPLIKTVYALRCFYGTSLQSGEDLKAELKSMSPSTKVMASLFVFLLWAALPGSLIAGGQTEMKAHDPSQYQAVLCPEELDRSIEEILTWPEFAWRMPREKDRREGLNILNPFKVFLEWIEPIVKKIIRPIVKLSKKIWDWLKKLFPEINREKEVSNTGWMTGIQGLLFVLLCLIACTLVVFIRRIWLSRRTSQFAVAVSETSAMPDLRDDRINADELPVDRWLALAKELIDQGSLRLALRAIYMATLAHLAKQKMISIAKYKSNRDYELELAKRAREKKELLILFSMVVMRFDRAWYGMYTITMEDVNLFFSDYERITVFA